MLAIVMLTVFLRKIDEEKKNKSEFHDCGKVLKFEVVLYFKNGGISFLKNYSFIVHLFVFFTTTLEYRYDGVLTQDWRESGVGGIPVK